MSGPRGTRLWNHTKPNKKKDVKKKRHTQKKTESTLIFDPPYTDDYGVNPTCSPTEVLARLHIRMICIYTYNRKLGYFDKKPKQNPSHGDHAGTAGGTTCRVGRGEQGEARPAIRAPRSEPNLDLGRFRLKTWSKYDFSITGTTWATLSSTFLKVKNRRCKYDSTAKGYVENKSCLNEKK